MVYMAGYFVGCSLSGNLADRLGRKRVVQWGGFLTAIVGCANAWIPNFYGFLAVRFLFGVALNITYPTLYCLGNVFDILYMGHGLFFSISKLHISVELVNNTTLVNYKVVYRIGWKLYDH